MKTIYCQAGPLQSALNKTNRFQALSIPTSFPSGAFVCLIEESQMSIDQLLVLKAQHAQGVFVYRLANHKESGRSVQQLMKIVMIGESQQVPIIREYHTIDQTVQFLIDLMYGTQSDVHHRRVVSVAGAKPQVGTTSMTLLLAQEITNKYEVNVCVLQFNAYNPSDLWFSYQGKYLDDIWGGCQGYALTPAELKNACHAVSEQLHVLAGNRYLTKVYHFKEEGAAHLIKVAQEAYDLVLIDVGCYIDHALSVQALEQSDINLLVMDQSIDAREQWKRTKDQILRPLTDVSDDKWFSVFNKIIDRNELTNTQQLQKELGYPQLCALPFIHAFFAHEHYRNVFELQEKTYMESINALARSIVKPYEFKAKQVKKRRLF